MRVKEDLVFDKHNGQVVGFVKLSDVDNQLSELESKYDTDQEKPHPDIATHLLVLMVRGLFSHIKYPYAHFATTGVSADSLLSIIWEAVRQLEMCGFTVMGVTSDGASPNGKFYRLRSTGDTGIHVPVYRTINLYSPHEKWLYFFCNVPHLIKTTKNCWSHSFSHNHTRQLWVNIHALL